jgi:1-acyl-sn-glycerol-3-phosphate acyltransferase
VRSSRLMPVSAKGDRAASRNPRPQISPLLARWFLGYARNYARKSFHAVRVAEEHNALSAFGHPLLVYMNHPSWWDPIVSALLCSEYFRTYRHYAPIDAVALEKYKFFGRIGFFGVAQNDRRSVRRLLEVGSQILNDNGSALWVTPQARFADVRERPLRIGPAIAHLARQSPQCVVLPVAIEYAFWEERTPEALVRFGRPIKGSDLSEIWHKPEFFEAALTDTMNALAADSIGRNSQRFRVVASGKAGIGGVYDVWRRLKANLRGRSFRAEHGAQP